MSASRTTIKRAAPTARIGLRTSPRICRKRRRARRDSVHRDDEVAYLVACYKVIPCHGGRALHAQAIERKEALQEDIGFLQRCIRAWAAVSAIAEAEQL